MIGRKYSAANSQQPAASLKRTIGNSQQPGRNNQQPTTNNQQPIGNSQQPTANNQQPIFCGRIAYRYLVTGIVVLAGMGVFAAGTNGVGKVLARQVRNPFWPVGHGGEKVWISAQPKPKPTELELKKKAEEEERKRRAAMSAEAKAKEAKALADAKKKAEEEKKRAEREARMNTTLEEDWRAAQKALKFGNRMTARSEDGEHEKSCIQINNLAYADGDLLSFNHNGRRFTWRVKGLTRKTVRLVRIRAKRIEEQKKEK